MNVSDMVKYLYDSIANGQANLNTKIWIQNEGYGTDLALNIFIDKDGDIIISAS